jgi:hypothetical protein
MFTQADVDKLKAIIAGGAGLQSMTTAAGETYQFRSADDWLKLLATMQKEVNAQAGGSSTRFAATSKGV